MKIKAGTFNIQHGKDYKHFLATGEERIDLSLMADTVKKMDVDFCGLNEVRSQTGEGLCDQAKAIADRLGWYWAFAPAIPIRNGFYGNALVSRFPIKEIRTVNIRTAPEERTEGNWYEDRALLIATLDAEGREITVMSCHFGLCDIEKDRATQTVLDEAEQISSPLFFMGDLNLRPDDRRIKTIADALNDTADCNGDDVFTFPSDEPNRKIDYIFVKNCTHLSSEVPPIVAADHRPVRAEVEI